MAPGWWQDSAADRVLSERRAPVRSPSFFGLPLGHRDVLKLYQPRRIGSVTGHSATRVRLACLAVKHPRLVP